MGVDDLKSQPLRDDSEGFRTEREAYLSNLEAAERSGGLPDSLKPFQHSVEWPIDMADPTRHIGTHFKDPHKMYSGMKIHEEPPGTKYHYSIHYALDIQTGQGTPVYAPTACVLQYLNLESEGKRPMNVGQADVYLWSPELETVFTLAHLDEKSIPEFLLRDAKQPRENRSTIAPGTMIGSVARWSRLMPEEIPIPYDVIAVYGRSFDHLHFGINHKADVNHDEAYLNEHGLDGDRINPLLLLRRLY